jgi:hypothetical protein
VGIQCLTSIFYKFSLRVNATSFCSASSGFTCKLVLRSETYLTRFRLLFSNMLYIFFSAVSDNSLLFLKQGLLYTFLLCLSTVRLDSSLKRTEQKFKIQRWSPQSDKYIHSVHVAAVTQRQRILRQLFTDVCSHSFIQCLLKKYCG